MSLLVYRQTSTSFGILGVSALGTSDPSTHQATRSYKLQNWPTGNPMDRMWRNRHKQLQISLEESCQLSYTRCCPGGSFPLLLFHHHPTAPTPPFGPYRSLFSTQIPLRGGAWSHQLPTPTRELETPPRLSWAPQIQNIDLA